SFGIARILGTLAMVSSIFLSLIGRFPTSGDIMIAVGVLVGSMVLVGLAGWQLIRRLPQDRRGRHILLREELARGRGYVSATARPELVGAEGVTLTDLRPAGTASVSGERIDVVSEGPWIAAGTPVRVVRAEGYRHVVAPIASL